MDFKQIGTLGTPIIIAAKNQLPELDGSYKGIFFKTTYDPSSEEDYPKGTILTVVENSDGTFSWSKPTILEKLTNGITDGSQLLKNIEAFDERGNKIIGTLEQVVLPTLTNEGVAADLAKGKQLISSKGEVITGTGENKINQYLRKTLTEVTADDFNGVIEIPLYAFHGSTGLTSITIGSDVMTIGDYAFLGCTGLTSIIIPDSITNIGDYAFYGCTGLTNVILLSTTPPTLGSSIFSKAGITKIVVPKGTLEDYQTTTNWKEYASYMVEATE